MKKIISILFVLALLIIPSESKAASLPTDPIITGPSGTLLINTSYDFNFVSTDPQGRQIWYEVEFDSSGLTLYFPPFFQYVNSGTMLTASKSYSSPGNHYLKVRAKNTNNNYSNWMTYNFTITAPNVAPSAPVVTNNTSAVRGNPITFSFSSSDGNGDNVRYSIDIGADGSTEFTVPSSGYVAQNTTQNFNYTWSFAGDYSIAFKATDVNEASSGWTTRSVHITNPNSAPSKPVVNLTAGQSPVYPKLAYSFDVVSTDADGDDVLYWIDWNNDGSGDQAVWFDKQGVTRTFTNPDTQWPSIGSYTFGVFAVDSLGATSETTIVNVNVVKPPTPKLFLRLTPPYLTPGQPVHLSIDWSSIDATSCHAFGLTWPGHNTTSGSYTTTGTVSGPREYTWVCTGNGVTATTTTALNFPVPLKGWGWSSNIGWISFSSANSGTFGNYSVNISTSSQYSYMNGWAWSPNIGWISFESGDNVHPNPYIDMFTGSVLGWARACSATVDNDCKSAPISSGWDGWISMSGNNYTSPGSGVTYDVNTGKFNGFAWGSEVLGWLNFDTGISDPVISPILFSSSTPACTLSIATSPSTMTPAGGTATVNWTSTNVKNDSCELTGPSVNIVNISSPGSGGRTFNLPANTDSVNRDYRYYFRCNSGAIMCSAVTTVPPPPGIDNPIPKMWLDNDPLKSKAITSILVGQTAKVNWMLGTKYTGCKGNNVSQTDSSLPSGPTWFSRGILKARNEYLSEINNLNAGVYELNLLCDQDKKTNTVKIIVKDPNASKIEEI